MTATNLCYQCRMRQGTTDMIGWIEARGAHKGAHLELKTNQFDSGE